MKNIDDIIQITDKWSINITILKQIHTLNKPLSQRELFTKHGLMVYNGEPYTGDKRGNIGGNTLANCKKWLGQTADFTMASNKILIENVKEASAINHTTGKPLYKPYVQSLFHDYLNRELMSNNFNFSLISDYIPQKFNILGNMYHAFMESVNNNSYNEYLDTCQSIHYPPFHYYVMQCLRNSIKQNINNAIEGISANGLSKQLLYTISGKPITDEQWAFITSNYINPIKRGNQARGITYQINLTNEINRRIKNDFKKKENKAKLYNGLQIESYSPICEVWEFQISKSYSSITPTINIDFCRRKLNENAIQKVLNISGYDTLLKYYHIQRDIEGKDYFLVPAELERYTKNFPFHYINLGYYLNDLDVLIKDIA